MAARVADFVESGRADATVCAYAGEDWLTRDPDHPRVRLEERIVRASARHGRMDELPESAQLGVDPACAAAFGDNYNDVAMLRAVGHPFCMGNAPERCAANLSATRRTTITTGRPARHA